MDVNYEVDADLTISGKTSKNTDEVAKNYMDPKLGYYPTSQDTICFFQLKTDVVTQRFSIISSTRILYMPSYSYGFVSNNIQVKSSFQYLLISTNFIARSCRCQ